VKSHAPYLDILSVYVGGFDWAGNAICLKPILGDYIIDVAKHV
jgi:hypothetical protein